MLSILHFCLTYHFLTHFRINILYSKLLVISSYDYKVSHNDIMPVMSQLCRDGVIMCHVRDLDMIL